MFTNTFTMTLPCEQFRIRTAPHERFRREGNDLHTTVTISLVLPFIQLPLSKMLMEKMWLCHNALFSELLASSNMLHCSLYTFFFAFVGFALDASNYISLLQLQALVGFEKNIKHLDNHLVEIGTKVSPSHLLT